MIGRLPSGSGPSARVRGGVPRLLLDRGPRTRLAQAVYDQRLRPLGPARGLPGGTRRGRENVDLTGLVDEGLGYVRHGGSGVIRPARWPPSRRTSLIAE